MTPNPEPHSPRPVKIGSKFGRFLNGVGVEEVGEILPLFRFLLFFIFLSFSVSRIRENNCNLLENEEFHSNPVCTDPIQNFPKTQNLVRKGSKWGRGRSGSVWEGATVSHKRVFALLTPENPHLDVAQMLQKPVFAPPCCQ